MLFPPYRPVRSVNPLSQVVGRFAPSPSGRMHLGNLLCSLLAWLSARSAGGRVVLRIEDLDAMRCPRTFADLLEQDRAGLAPPNEPLTCGLVDRHGMPLRAGDTVAADKFFVYAVRYGSHNVNPDNCAPAYQVGWYLEIMWAYPGFEDSVGHTEPLYDIDGTAARYPAHCADTADGLYNLKLEVCCRPPEGEEDT